MFVYRLSIFVCVSVCLWVCVCVCGLCEFMYVCLRACAYVCVHARAHAGASNIRIDLAVAGGMSKTGNWLTNTVYATTVLFCQFSWRLCLSISFLISLPLFGCRSLSSYPPFCVCVCVCARARVCVCVCARLLSLFRPPPSSLPVAPSLSLPFFLSLWIWKFLKPE